MNDSDIQKIKEAVYTTLCYWQDHAQEQVVEIEDDNVLDGIAWKITMNLQEFIDDVKFDEWIIDELEGKGR